MRDLSIVSLNRIRLYTEVIVMLYWLALVTLKLGSDQLSDSLILDFLITLHKLSYIYSNLINFTK